MHKQTKMIQIWFVAAFAMLFTAILSIPLNKTHDGFNPNEGIIQLSKQNISQIIVLGCKCKLQRANTVIIFKAI